MSNFNYNEENEWTKHWRINHVGTASSENRCAAWESDTDIKYPT